MTKNVEEDLEKLVNLLLKKIYEILEINEKLDVKPNALTFKY